jgi:hypothetical protein
MSWGPLASGCKEESEPHARLMCGGGVTIVNGDRPRQPCADCSASRALPGEVPVYAITQYGRALLVFFSSSMQSIGKSKLSTAEAGVCVLEPEVEP